MVVTQPRPHVPEVLLQLCPALPEAKDGKLGTLLQNHIETARAYHLCAGRHRDLVDVVRAQGGQ